jgi:Na+-driven multidrug efflux pump
MCGVIRVLAALFPVAWTNLFTDSEAVRAASGAYLQIAGPEYLFWLIAAGMATQAVISAVVIRLGAWTRDLDRVQSQSNTNQSPKCAMRARSCRFDLQSLGLV